MILDEPFTGADPVSRHDLAVLFRELADEGVDILISSHVLHEVEALTRQILMIDHGRIVAAGDLRAVRQELRHRPHTVRIRVDAPRRLAARVTALEVVSGLRVADDETLIVETTSPPDLYQCVTAAALDDGVIVRELVVADESLEAVFGYLTGARPAETGGPTIQRSSPA
jgi:ABC-2 type transport system ATP-binding protein